MIETFASYLELNRGLSKNTISAYKEALKDFAQFINEHHKGTRWSTVTKLQIDEYVVDMLAEGFAASSIKQHVCALRTFYKTCQALGGMKDNPARYVSTPKIAEKLPETIEREAVRNALESPTASKQAKAAIAILYETGLRLQELLDLEAKDIDASKQAIRVHGKGRKERIVYYGELTKKYGRCWNGKEHSQRAVRHMVFEALKPFTKAEHISPHVLRHTYACELVNNGMSIEAISTLLGHENLETTQIYARLANKTTQSLYLQFAPTV